MRLRGTLVLLCLLLAPASNGAGPPAGEPAAKEQDKKTQEEFKDSLIPGYDDSFIVDGKWAEGLKYYREELIKALAADKPDLLAGQRLLYAHDVCRLFPAIKAGVPSPNDGPFTRWLLSQPNLVRLLTDAVRPEDDLAGVFRVLYVIKAKAKLEKATHADLMVALAIVHDKQAPRADLKGDGGRVMELFWYYTRNSSAFRVPTRSVPYFMLKYVVDNNVTAEERKWALEQYGGAVSVTRLYASVPYDSELLKEGESKNRKHLDERGYTLRNVKKYGGVCVDQAYFASRVCKSVCVPSASFSGRDTKTGVGHAWASAARKTGDGWIWIDGGRHQGLKSYISGTTRDPQTGKTISDRDCWLETRLSSISVNRRLRSRFCLTAALWMEREEDIKRALSYLELAVRTNPHNTEAWQMAARFCSEGKLKADVIGDFYKMILAEFRDYPQFSRGILEQLRNAIPQSDVKRHVLLYDITWRTYQRRFPDIAATVLADKGTYLMTRGQAQGAFSVYSEAVTRYRKNGPVVEMLLDRAEPLYRSQKALAAYIRLIEPVMSSFRRQEGSVARSSLYYSATHRKLATRLRDLHAEIGNEREAEYYENLIKKLEPKR
ncbi:MAG: hypothetical protein ABIF82_02160 [Planctomycetota bacterium]